MKLKTKIDSYHHGALREALLAAAEDILRKDGRTALTLRATARAAGVSHAAPTHHFKDLSGLLSELAALGFERLAETVSRATAASEHAQASGHAYVRFAANNPGLFLLMFRSEQLDSERPALQQARAKAMRALAAGRRVAISESLPVSDVATMASAWGLAHGLAMLMIDGRMKSLLSLAPAGTDAMSLVDAVYGWVPEKDKSPARVPDAKKRKRTRRASQHTVGIAARQRP